MRYKDCQCVYCNNVFTENDDAVTCPKCGSPHHRECWFKENKCANEALHGEGFLWKFPEELDPVKKLNESKKQGDAPEETPFRFKNGESAVVCPHCKGLNYGNDAVCMRCGKPLYQSRPENIQGNEQNEGFSLYGGTTNKPNFPDESDMGANPYTSGNNDGFAPDGVNGRSGDGNYYSRFGGLYPDVLVSGIPAAEMAEYIGEKKSGRYIRKFAVQERFGKRFSVSVWAFILGPIWFFYRKLYKEGLLFLLAFAFITIVNGFCMVTTPLKDAYSRISEYFPLYMEGEITMDEFAEISDEIMNSYTEDDFTQADIVKIRISEILSYVNMGLSLAAAFVGENLYRKKIIKDVHKTRDECHDMASYMAELKRKGGVSVGAAVLGAIAMAVAFMLGYLPVYIVVIESFFGK